MLVDPESCPPTLKQAAGPHSLGSPVDFRLHTCHRTFRCTLTVLFCSFLSCLAALHRVHSSPIDPSAPPESSRSASLQHAGS
jgi:hypothetical protein